MGEPVAASDASDTKRVGETESFFGIESRAKEVRDFLGVFAGSHREHARCATLKLVL